MPEWTTRTDMRTRLLLVVDSKLRQAIFKKSCLMSPKVPINWAMGVAAVSRQFQLCKMQASPCMSIKDQVLNTFQSKVAKQSFLCLAMKGRGREW